LKNIIITGASRGIGKEVAVKFLLDTDNCVFLISRNKDLLYRLTDEVGSAKDRFFPIPFDLVSGDYNNLVDEVTTIAGSIDILINNAGALVNKQFSEISIEEFNQVMDTNFKAPFLLIKQLLPYFNKGAHIVNITSMGGFQGSVKFPGLSIYSASKGALNTLTECLALEFETSNISVNSLALGSVNTPMLESAFPGYISKTSSSSIAEYITWFALNANKWMNGKIIPVALSVP
jgi:NAD(P)-dependent dehydrogenase (short-subunit alcohol dehydrogenase family)